MQLVILSSHQAHNHAYTSSPINCTRLSRYGYARYKTLHALRPAASIPRRVFGNRPATTVMCSTSGLQAIGTWYKSAPATAKVSVRTGLYILALGVALFIKPVQLFGLLFDARSLPAPGWIRVGGVLASLYGAYYLGAALDDAEGRKPVRFYQSTIIGRLILAAAFTGLVYLKQCGTGLLLLAGANIVSAAAMHLTLSQAANSV